MTVHEHTGTRSAVSSIAYLQPGWRSREVSETHMDHLCGLSGCRHCLSRFSLITDDPPDPTTSVLTQYLDRIMVSI